MRLTRRSFVKKSAIAATSLFAAPASAAVAQPIIPRWRGFNLTELASGHRGQLYQESDFEWMAEWGFNFVRLPCSYWTWSDKSDWTTIDEKAVVPLDRAVALGRQYGIHVNICLHRLPGYCVNGAELERFQLFGGSQESMMLALEAAVHQWRFLAERYKSASRNELSFDLLNEPPFMSDHSRYIEIARTLISCIRETSPDRLIFVDGADIGQTPVFGLVDQAVVQSTRGYLPKMISHYTATWVPPNEFESLAMPTWPMTDSHGIEWNRDKLRQELLSKWQVLSRLGVPVHVGEWGCLNKTPHDVCLSWMDDLLTLWKEANWGWAIWNLRGPFGIVDSERSDAPYEKFRGHRLDRKMLDLLKSN
jgi:endoglucanase